MDKKELTKLMVKDECTSDMNDNLSIEEVLDICKAILVERGNTYNKNQEDSFTQTVNAFNAIKNTNLTVDDFLLLMVLLKEVRNANHMHEQSKPHNDSIIDGINYAILKATKLIKRY